MIMSPVSFGTGDMGHAAFPVHRPGPTPGPIVNPRLTKRVVLPPFP
jgi:hypothetical protein